MLRVGIGSEAILWDEWFSFLLGYLSLFPHLSSSVLFYKFIF